ncbi:leucine-rich repeat flightless-interacting protein 1 isoform X1 [Ictalurus punctatus]|uniref:Leucine-rich repeat flightless-interacting protein 1 isoform X1 n=2 Tax=Ictalurus punctatus TaxID=7998 RepID=A0A2D0RST7_ICTPU|nr:leucine-rich repeat flightless-interacting protein 1 isoform X1 [Ictalurus punctatus]
MKTFLSALGAGVAKLRLRPLMYTTGTAATAAAIYYYVKRGDGKKTTSDPEVTPEDPVCDQAMEPALVQPIEVPRDQVMGAVRRAEEKIQKLVVSSTKLEDRVKELEELLCEARNECEREREAHFILQSEYDEMKENLMDKKQLLKVSQSEDEKKHQKAVETIAQLEVENSDLKDQVERLQGRVQNMENLLHATEWECDKLVNDFHMEEDEIKKGVIHIMELLKVSLAEDEEKHQKAVETIAQLEVEKSDLKDQVERLRLRVWEMENLLHETYRWSADQMNECEREREAYVILQSEYDEMKENLMDKEQLLKVSQSEDEPKPQKAVETIAQLVMEKADLIDQVERLRLRVWEMENLHHETYRWSADQMNECEREWEAHVILQSEYDELKENLVSSLIQGDNKY